MKTTERIRNLREDFDLTQQDLAGYLHISQRAYSHYEMGTRKIPLDILIALADFYNCSVDYLLCRTTKDRYQPVMPPVKRIRIQR